MAVLTSQWVLTLLLIVGTDLLSLVLGLTNLFPIVDLNYIRDLCEEYGQEVDQQMNEVNSCLQLIPNHIELQSSTTVQAETEQSSTNNSTVIECKYSSVYLNCYAKATQALNSCEPGRGEILRRIHEAFHAQICVDGGLALQTALQNSKGGGVHVQEFCVPAFNTTDECISEDAYDAWESTDLCRSFNALLACQESALLRSETCAKPPLTRLLIRKLWATQLDLNCSPLDDMTDTLGSLFPNPHQELVQQRLYCEKIRGVPGVESAINEARHCMEQNTANEAENHGAMVDQCRRAAANNKCWDPIMSKIDECIRGRGTSVTTLYITLVQAACVRRDALKALRSDERCVPNSEMLEHARVCKPSLSILNPEVGDGDVCTSFRWRRACIEEAIANCTHVSHKMLIEATFNQVDGDLKCGASNAWGSVLLQVFCVQMILLFYHMCYCLKSQ